MTDYQVGDFRASPSNVHSFLVIEIHPRHIVIEPIISPFHDLGTTRPIIKNSILYTHSVLISRTTATSYADLVDRYPHLLI